MNREHGLRSKTADLMSFKTPPCYPRKNAAGKCRAGSLIKQRRAFAKIAVLCDNQKVEKRIGEVMESSVGDEQNPTLLPRFSIRALLGMLTICAVAFLVAGMAYRGQYWAWGVTIGLASLLLAAVVHAAWFGIAWTFARMTSAPKDVS